MAFGDDTDSFDRLLAITLFGARAGFASGLGLAAAEVSTMFAPLAWEAPLFVLSGATCTACFWWVGSRVLQTAGHRSKR